MVKNKKEAKYSGCNLNNKSDITKELAPRMGATAAVWKKAGLVLEKIQLQQKHKLIIYDAIVRAKLVYGLETAQINKSDKDKNDIFYLRGLRKIMNWPTTWETLNKVKACRMCKKNSR